jgi:MoxR-like ATPase
MNSQQLIQAIRVAYFASEPVFIWGPPGIGKTDCVAQACAVLGAMLVKEKKLKKASDFGLVDFRMAMRDPTDIKGFPMPDQATKTMRFFRDAELPTDGYGIVFMDELNSSAPATQAAGMQLTLKNHKGEHRIGDYVLPPGWTVAAAGNRETDRGVVHRMPTPLANRFTHLNLEVDAKSWVEYALHHDISAELIAWIRFKEGLLFKFDPKLDSKAFPTPRSWVRTEKFVNADVPDPVKVELIKGTVGDGPGTEYWAFRKLIDQLPTLEEIRLNPSKTKVPGHDQLSARYAITTLMGANASESSFEAFLEYGERMDKEFQAVFVRDALAREPKLRTAKVYTKWALKNADVIL